MKKMIILLVALIFAIKNYAQDTLVVTLTHGEKISAAIAVILIIIDCMLCPLLYLQNVFSIYYLIIITVSVIIFLYASLLLVKNQSSETAKKASKYLKIGILIAFIAFAIGSF